MGDEAEFTICDYWIEGRISLLKRRFGLARCRYHGELGMERWVGLGLLAHNLCQISRSVAARATD